MVRFQELDHHEQAHHPSQQNFQGLKNDLAIDDEMELARNTHGMLMVGGFQRGGQTALHHLSAVSRRLVGTSMSNLEEARTERSSVSSGGSLGLHDRELDVQEMRAERRRLTKAGFTDEAAAFDPLIEAFRQERIRLKEEKFKSRLESKLSVLKIRQTKELKKHDELAADRIAEMDVENSRNKLRLIQNCQCTYERLMEKIMISAADMGKGTKYRYKMGPEVKRLLQNVEGLEKKGRFKEASHYRRSANQLEKSEKKKWWDYFLHHTVGNHPNSAIAKELAKSQNLVKTFDTNHDSKLTLIKAELENDRNRILSAHRAELNKVRSIVRQNIRREDEHAARLATNKIQVRNFNALGVISKNLTSAAKSIHEGDVKTRVNPIRSDGSVWTPPLSSGIQTDNDAGETHCHNDQLPPPWEDSSSEEDLD